MRIPNNWGRILYLNAKGAKGLRAQGLDKNHAAKTGVF